MSAARRPQGPPLQGVLSSHLEVTPNLDVDVDLGHHHHEHLSPRRDGATEGETGLLTGDESGPDVDSDHAFRRSERHLEDGVAAPLDERRTLTEARILSPAAKARCGGNAKGRGRGRGRGAVQGGTGAVPQETRNSNQALSEPKLRPRVILTPQGAAC